MSMHPSKRYIHRPPSSRPIPIPPMRTPKAPQEPELGEELAIDPRPKEAKAEAKAEVHERQILPQITLYPRETPKEVLEIPLVPKEPEPEAKPEPKAEVGWFWWLFNWY